MTMAGGAVQWRMLPTIEKDCKFGGTFCIENGPKHTCNTLKQLHIITSCTLITCLKVKYLITTWMLRVSVDTYRYDLPQNNAGFWLLAFKMATSGIVTSHPPCVSFFIVCF